MQTTNGTRTITFNNFNVVKTDVNGNATVNQKLSANSVVTDSLVVNSLTASNFTTTAGPAVSLPTGFYNQFTIVNGLILSATSNVPNDPVYNQLYNNDIPLYVNGILKNLGVTPVVERYGVVSIPAGSTSYTVTIDSFFAAPPTSNISVGNITPAHINLATDFVPTTGTLADFTSYSATNSAIYSSLSAVTWPEYVIPVIQPNSITTTSSSDGTPTALTFVITIGNTVSTSVNVYWRLNVVIPLKNA